MSSPIRRALVRVLAFTLTLLATNAHAQQLVPRTRPTLAYPPGESATPDVFVEIEVDETGGVVNASVTRRDPPETSTAFDPPALAFARALAFEPVVVGGVATKVRTEIKLHFERPAAPAQGAPEPAAKGPPALSAEKVKVDLGPVPTLEGRVRSTRMPSSAADFHLHVGDLAAVPRKSAAEQLTLAPGILLTNHGGEGHAPAIFLRGFDAGEGQDLEFRLDGVPLNEVANAHSHGYADPHFIIPELVDELRVTEGPFDPRQGDFAVAGSAEYHLGLHARGLRVTGGAGSYGARRLLLLWGPKGETDGTFTGVDLKSGDGFGPNRGSASASGMAQYEAQLEGGTKVVVGAQSYASRFQSGGVLRQDDFEARRLPCGQSDNEQFFCTYDTNQGGAMQRQGATAKLVRKLRGATLEQQLFFTRRKLRLTENFTGWLVDVPRSGEPERGDLSEKLYQSNTAGLRGSLAMRRRALGARQELELGYYARADWGESASRRLRADGGEAYRRDFDVAFDVTNLATYGAATLRLVPDVTVRAGVRVDTFAFSLLDRNRPTQDRSGRREPSDARDAFGYVLEPRLSVQWALAPGLDWITSLGRGARSSDASALSDGEFAPFSAVDAAETGLALERAGEGDKAWTLSARASAYATKVDQALVFDETLARNTLQGASNRFGALALARVGWGGWVDAQASSTWAEAFQPGADAGYFALADGPRLPYVPRWVHRLDAAARRPLSIGGQAFDTSAGLGVTYVAPRPLPLGKLGDPILTVDASVRAQWKALEISLSVTNLLDARYRLAEFNFASNFRGPDVPPSLRAARHFAAGAPRMGFLTLTYQFDESLDDASGHDVHAEEHDEEHDESGEAASKAAEAKP